MNSTTRGTALSAAQRRFRTIGVSGLVVSLLLTGCTPSEDSPEEVAPSQAATTTPAPEPTTEPFREARDGWKVFSDPSRSVSFELPEAWLVQPLEPEPGAYAPDSLHYAVRTSEGTTTAELHSGILTEEAPCPDIERTPYYVLASEPLELTETPAATTEIEPRFVARIITGFRFFGSYGVTDQLGGADGLGCSLSNTVDGGGSLGRLSFGDLEVLVPKLPANTGPQNVTFGTIGEAEAYYATPEFATIGEMIKSLRVAPPAEPPA